MIQQSKNNKKSQKITKKAKNQQKRQKLTSLPGGNTNTIHHEQPRISIYFLFEQNGEKHISAAETLYLLPIIKLLRNRIV